jgi:hypothetical protein
MLIADCAMRSLSQTLPKFRATMPQPLMHWTLPKYRLLAHNFLKKIGQERRTDEHEPAGLCSFLQAATLHHMPVTPDRVKAALA